MQMSIFCVLFVVAINWLAGVILFEHLHLKGFFSGVLSGYDKAQCCKVWVIGETFLYLLLCPGAFMFALLMLWTIGVSHYFLCAANARVTVVGVIWNIPAAVKKAVAIVQPYIK